MKKTNVLIIGGGAAGILTGLVVKKFSPKTKVLVIKDEKDIIIRCSEPYVLGGIANLQKIIHPDEGMFKNNGIDFLIDKVVDFLDFPKKKIALTKDGEKIKFEQLVLATGANPFVPPIPGLKEQKNILTLRQANDLVKIKKAVSKSKKAVVIGGGAIGLEVATMLRRKGLSVTILEVADQLMPGAYDKDYADKIKKVIEDNKIKVKLGVRIQEVNEKEIIIPSEKIKYDFIVCSCGVRPEIELAQKLGCRIDKFGIQINQFGQTSVNDIWAAGDCVQAKDFITGQPIPSRLATTAVLMGKTVAMNLLGKRMTIPKIVNPAVSCFFDFGVGRVGLTKRQAEKSGIKTIIGEAQSTTQYPSQPTAQPIEIKLIFNAGNKRIIGAQLFGGKGSLGMRVNLLSLAITRQLTMNDLAKMNYCAHPEETPLPFMEPIVMAAENAMGNKLT